MGARVDIGTDGNEAPVEVDLEELLATRLLVQGNSGSGKSHLLRRLLEGSAESVQQIIIDPEGDFVSLGEVFGHVAIEASDYSSAEVARMAERIREHRASVVLSLEGLELEAQMRCAAAFLSALFDAPREHWYPAIVVVDEAQVFAPAVAGEVSDEARRASLGAMTNLMCRGRKRGSPGSSRRSGLQNLRRTSQQRRPTS
jgi:DNA helicase HerA-like ATPase